MTKIIPLIMLCAGMAFSVLNAQSTTGKFTLQTGIGLLPTYHGKNAKTNVPSLNFQAGINISKRFSLNAYVAYTEATSTPRTFSDGLTSQVENKTTMFGLRSQFSKDFTDKLALYGGVLLGYASFNRTEFDLDTGEAVNREPDAPTPYNPNAPEGQFLYSGFFGAKYAINPVIGVFGEVGCGISLLNMGIAVNL